MRTRSRLLLTAALALLAVSPAAAQQTAAPGPKALPDWSDYMKALEPVGARVIGSTPHPDDPQARQESWRILMGTLAQGFISHVYADPDHPEFTPSYSTALNLAAPNPDYMYLGTPIRGDGVYRIRGFRGTNRFVQFTANVGSYQMGTAGALVGDWDLDGLKLGPDGAFDVILSAERPKGYAGDWWKLDPRARTLGVRQVSYDWVHERDASLTIERLDAPATRPRLTAEELSARMADLATWVEKGSILWWKRIAEMREQGVINKVQPHAWSGIGGAPNQIYDEGLFNLADDEALVLESAIPRTCRYWSFLVGDDQFATVDWMNHQSSLNGYQARLDKDGMFRAVISNKDPGVPNWLDAGGYREGIIQVRWNKCDSSPVPTARKVKFADLRKVLPADTPVVTAAQRDESLRERRFGAQLRRKW